MIFAAELERFKEEHWGRTAYSCQLAQAAMASIRSELDDFDVDAIARKHDRPITVWFDEGQRRSVDMSCENALELYDAGYQIYVVDIDRPILREWCRHLSAAFEVPDYFSCSVLAAKTPHLTSTHFDHVENFTIQLAGTKTWSISENRAVQLPTVNYNGGGSRHHEELNLYVKSFPITEGEVTTDYTLTPGHMVYVPRGFWHSVSGVSGEPMVSLLICYPATTWADLIAPAFRSLLLRSARWRENAKLPSETGSEEKRRFDSIIAEAAADLATLDMSCLLPSKTFGPVLPEMLVRNPLATIEYDESGETGHVRAISTVHLGPHTRRREADIRADLRPMLEYVLGRDATPLGELSDKVGEFASLPEVLDILRKLDLARPTMSATAAVRG